jgi:hypothetical protein
MEIAKKEPKTLVFMQKTKQFGKHKISEFILNLTSHKISFALLSPFSIKSYK